MSYTQDEVYMKVSTPLGEDKLHLTGFRGEESMFGLFSFSLEMLSEDGKLDFNRIVGESATVSLELADGKRYFNGIVSRFALAGKDVRFYTYYAELRPWLWQLTLTTDSRIFQNQSVPDIIEAVFSDFEFSDYRVALDSRYESREYCVQYQETAYDFVCRLMEDEGIYFFFEHTEDSHTMVLADSPGAHKPCPGLSKARLRTVTSPWTEEDAVTECTAEGSVVSGKYTMGDFNFEIPSTSLTVESVGGEGDLPVFEYPGWYSKKEAGETKSDRRMEMVELPETVLKGTSCCKAFTPGYTFELTDHFHDDVNDSYVIRQVTVTATRDAYFNSFEAFYDVDKFRPPLSTPLPRIAGCQTAIVVGPSDEEIFTDKYGRVKVQFHWDRQGANDENSSCWVRVAQGWAGKTWGQIFIPRIGQEVVVSFLEGNPDRPLITGSVYNAQQTVPYVLPENQTRSTVMSNSSKGGEGFNEIRFEDKAGEEEIYVHAQKDMNIEVLNDRTKTVGNDETITVTNNRTTEISEGNDTLTVAQGNRETTISQGDDTLNVDSGNRTVTLSTGNETRDIMGKRDQTVTGDESHTNNAKFTHEVMGDYKLTVMGNLTIESMGKVVISALQDIELEGLNAKLTGNLTLTAEGNANAALKCGGAKVDLLPAMAQVSGPAVKIG